MNVVGIAVAVIAGVLLGLGVAGLFRRSRGREEDQIAALRQEMQATLSAQAQAFTAQLGQVNQSVNQQLGQVGSSLQKGLTDSGLLVSKAHEAVAAELKNSQELLGRVGKQLGEVQQAGRDLSQAAQTLQTVLSGAKTRGSLGEVALDALLADALPQSAYETQYRFTTGNVVDAIVRSGDRILPIDSKFPLEAYRRLLESGEGARREFAQAVRKHADSIAEKYILPDEHTMDFALMFVPSESVYYELLMTEDGKYGRLDEYCRTKRVLPVSSNTCYAYLCAIALSLKGLKFEENARRLLGSLTGLKRQIDCFAEVYEKLGTHLRHTQQAYEDADSRLARARNSLELMADGALPEAVAPPKALEPATQD
jgi:DNA recombination protein RmuC